MKVIICIVVVVFGVMEISKYGNKQKRALGKKRQRKEKNCGSVVPRTFIVESLNSASEQVQIMLTACWRSAMLRTCDSGPDLLALISFAKTIHPHHHQAAVWFFEHT